MMHAASSSAVSLVLLVTSMTLGVVVVRRDARSACRDGLVAHGARCCSETAGPNVCIAGVDPTVTARPGRVRFSGRAVELRGQSFERSSARNVTVTLAPFDLAREELRCADALAVLGREASSVTSTLCAGDAKRAAGGLRFVDAERVCAALGGRLPTEEEWEFAAGSGGTRYPWGETGATCRAAVWGLATGPCAHGLRGPDTVGARPAGATPEGVLDLAGNVAEWVRSNDGGAVKGGDFTSYDASNLRVLARRTPPMDTADPRHGARCAFAPEP